MNFSFYLLLDEDRNFTFEKQGISAIFPWYLYDINCKFWLLNLNIWYFQWWKVAGYNNSIFCKKMIKEII
jgi:hypothetical protein